VARALIVGCGCRGRALGRRLLDEGWAVRGTSRREEGLAEIRAAGLEPAIADPDRPGTLLELVADVAVVHWLMGSASGEPELLAEIHGPRLERLLERLVETPVRGFVYEAAGSVPAPLLEGGAASVRRAGETWRIPFSLVEAGPADPLGWVDAAFAATVRLASAAGEAI
jgi:nucleoside-diphosphate-sugar epimerase